MKVLLKKIKKANTLKKLFYFFNIIIYIASLIFMTYEASIFKDTEPVLLIIILILLIIWGLFYILSGLTSMLSNKNKKFIVITIISILLSIILSGGAFYIHQKKSQFDNIVRNNVTYTTNLIALKSTKFDEKKPIGMVESASDIEGNILAKKLIKEEKLDNEIYYYEDYVSMI